jgi:enoyl-CoA hydratase
MTGLVLTDAPAEGVLRLTLNRPEARNALNQELRDALVAALGAAAADPAVRAVVLTGNEKAFVTGADIKAMAEATPVSIRAGRGHLIWEAVSAFEKPLIAAVRGYALGGGCELAMACDIIIASETAVFGQPEIKVGIMPGAGGVTRLIRRLGGPRALRLLLTGETFSGAQAAAWGLASEAVADDQVADRAVAMAAAIAGLPAASARAILRTATLGDGAPIDQALAAEREMFLSLFATPDQREGMAAFLEKRPPQFNR